MPKPGQRSLWSIFRATANRSFVPSGHRLLLAASAVIFEKIRKSKLDHGKPASSGHRISWAGFTNRRLRANAKVAVR